VGPPVRNRRGWPAALAVGALSTTLVLSGSVAAASRGQLETRCRRALQHTSSQHPQKLTGPPPAVLSSLLELLRLPATNPTEAPPRAIPASEYSALWINHIRRVGEAPRGTLYYAIASRVALPAICARELRGGRRGAYEKLRREEQAGSLILEAIGSRSLLARGTFTAGEIEGGRALVELSTGIRSAPEIAGLVPDGVASVTITPAGLPGVTTTVTHNFLVTALAAIPRGGASYKIAWHNSAGATVGTFRVAAIGAVGETE